MADVLARVLAGGVTLLRQPLADGAEALIIRPALPAPWCVVLVHGGGNDRLFGLWALLDELLTAGIAVATAHLPGHGAGGTDLFSAAATRIRLDALVEMARVTSGAARVAVLGQSLGGAFALDRLARGRVAEPVVAVSVPLALTLGPAAVGELLTLARPETWRAIRGLGLRDVLPAFGPFNRERFPIRVAAGAGYLDAFRQALVTLDLEARLALGAGETAQVLLVHGERDAIAPVTHGRRLLAALAPKARWLGVPGGRHFDPLLRREVVAEIAAWLARLGAAPQDLMLERIVPCAPSPPS